MNMHKPKYILTYNNIDIDISDIVSTQKTVITRNLCTTEFKSAIDTASIVLKAPADRKELRAQVYVVLQDAIDTLEKVYLKILYDNMFLFTGTLKLSDVSFQSKKLSEDINLSAEDISADLLDKKIATHILLENYHISALVDYLVSLAGGRINKNEIPANDDYVIPAYVVDAESDKTFREEIDLLLFEAGGYVLDTDSEGKMNIVSLPWKSYEPHRLIDNYIIADGISTSRQIFDKDGLKVKWSALAETDENQVIWLSDFSRKLEDGTLKGYELKEDAFYPENGDITATYQEFNVDFLDRKYQTNLSRKRNEDLSIIAVKNVKSTLSVIDSAGNDLNPIDCIDYPVVKEIGMESNPTIYPKKAWYLLHNKTSGNINLQFFSLKGKVLYRSAINYIQIPENAKKIEEYESTYIFTKKHAENFTKFYWHFKKNSQTVHKWSELGDVFLGEVVSIAHKDTAYAQAALIVTASLSFVGNTSKIKCTAVSLGRYDEYVIKSWGSSPDYKPNGPAGEAGITPVIEYRWGKSKDVPPVSGGLWFFDSETIFLENEIWGELEDAGWMSSAPTQPEGYLYLWMRISSDNRKTWKYSCIKGDPAVDFSLTASASTYPLSSRGVVVEETKIKFTIYRQNIFDAAIWTVTPPDFSYERLSEDQIEVTVPKLSEATFFKVDVRIGDIEKSARINGIKKGEKEPVYLGIYPQKKIESGEEVIIDKPNYSPYGPLIVGDHILYEYEKEDEKYQTTLYWDGEDWSQLNNSVENYAQIMSNLLADALKSKATVDSISALNGFFADLAAERAFFSKLFVNEIRLGEYDSILKKWKGALYSGGYDAGGNSNGQAGIFLGADGRVKANSAEFKNCAVDRLESDPFTTIIENQPGEIYYSNSNTPNRSYYFWKSTDIKNLVIKKIGPKSSFSVNIGGKNYNACYYPSTMSNDYAINRHTTGTVPNFSFTAKQDCTVYFAATGSRTTSSSGPVDITLKKNDEIIERHVYSGGNPPYSVGGDFTLKKGDTLSVRNMRADIQSIEWLYTGEEVLRITYGQYAPSGLTVWNYARDFNEEWFEYQSLNIEDKIILSATMDISTNPFPSEITPYSNFKGISDSNGNLVTQGELFCDKDISFLTGSFNGKSYTNAKINRIRFSSSFCYINLPDNAEILELNDVTFTESYSLVLNSYGQVVSNLTKDIKPKEKNTFRIGTIDNKYAEIHVVEAYADLLKGNVDGNVNGYVNGNEDSPSSKIYKVWGAVAN